MYQKKTLSKMPPLTKRLALACNAFELGVRRLKDIVPIVRGMESDADLYNKMSGKMHYALCSNPDCRKATPYIADGKAKPPEMCDCGSPFIELGNGKSDEVSGGKKSFDDLDDEMEDKDNE